ncbi:MAG: hypothetical protein ACLSUW_02490 [Akkermansia sp.]
MKYIDNWSLWLDIKLFRNRPGSAFARGAKQLGLPGLQAVSRYCREFGIWLGFSIRWNRPVLRILQFGRG